MLEITWVLDEERLVLALHAAWSAVRTLTAEAVDAGLIAGLDEYVTSLGTLVRAATPVLQS